MKQMTTSKEAIESCAGDLSYPDVDPRKAPPVR